MRACALRVWWEHQQYHKRNTKRFHTVYQASVSTPDIGLTTRNELDNQDDTICCDNNFRTLVLTGQKCEDKGFHCSLEDNQNFPVGRNATAWTDTQDVATYTLIYDRSLMFGNVMDHSLIYTNRSRLFGILVWENPYDVE